MDELISIATDRNPSVFSSSENSGTESNTSEDEQNPRPIGRGLNQRRRENSSPQFKNYVEGLEYLCFALKSFNV